MTEEDFVRHFVAHVKASKERPVTLLLDNHDWHLFIEVTYVNRAYDACITNRQGTTVTICGIPSVDNIPFYCKYQSRVSGIYLFSRAIFENEEFMEA
jgi:hypothetical protein